MGVGTIRSIYITKGADYDVKRLPQLPATNQMKVIPTTESESTGVKLPRNTRDNHE